MNNTININGLAPFVLAREFKNICSRGSIINFLDARMTDYEPNHISYQLSKQMLFNLTRMMSLEFAPSIRVNAVAPGIIIPDNIYDEESLLRLKEGNPLMRIGTLEEVTSTVLFLLQNEFITGQVIYVDGGRNLRGNVYGF
jgi:NAD(P)-dependent dehydrogenase (short-subunit alcohol dehydrogenase family)